MDDVVIADCAIDLEGRDLGDLFDAAAAALAALSVDPATVATTVERLIALEAPALDLLLHDWLSELIWLKDAERLVFTESRARVCGEGPARVEARVRGGLIEAGRTALRADAKAVTLHQLAVERAGDGWRARVVIDI